MVDVATLGMRVESDGVVVANKRLDKLEKQAGKTEKASERLVRQADKMSKAMGRIGRTLSLSVTAPLAAASAASVKLAIDAEETANKFDVVFRG
ncbi:MAG: hypothetical protein GVY36_19225, partial [Verrucomicrobia bacterium]|nr:hypothetical protein [Verrucomicrobiota bacterium]